MHISVLGASGRTGRHVVEQAVARGHAVSALVRYPQRFPAPQITTTRSRGAAPVRVQPGDALDAAAVDHVVAGADAVVVALGAPPRARERVLTRGTDHVIAAMHRHGVPRLLVLTSFALDGGDRLAGPLGAVVIGSSKLFTGPLWADKATQEQVVRDSGLDWTLVRPTTLSDAPATGTWIAAEAPQMRLSARIARADVALFLLDQLTDATWSRRAVRLLPHPTTSATA